MGKKAPFRLRGADNDPRSAALAVLFRVIHESEDSGAALDAALRSPRLAPTDKRLCTELVYGTLRRYSGLHSLVCGFLSDPEGIPAEMRLALVAAAYETAFLRSPHHAAVAWTVGHIRNRFGGVMAGVGNAVLRAVQRNLDAYHAARAAGETPEATLPELAAACDLPEHIVGVWADAYGRTEIAGLLRASGRAAPSGLRLNRSRPGWEALRETVLRDFADLHAAQGRQVTAVGPCTLAFDGSLPLSARKAVEEGRASRQSAAAYEVVQALSPEDWPRPIWDCCAGRGGKTLALLEQGIPAELATDRSAGRLRALGAECVRLGIPPALRPLTATLDLTDGAALPARIAEILKEASGLCGERAAEVEPSAEAERSAGGDRGRGVAAPAERFGTILLDAPCSGLGTLARRPEIRLRRQPESLYAAAALQARLLDNLRPLLKPGGRIVYITCTVNPAENEGQVAAFLARHPEASSGREFRTPFSSPLGEFFYGAELIVSGSP
jgi:16S rRNA (cytosine967-C5)-methyltransferase